jgi:hypothetical protein
MWNVLLSPFFYTPEQGAATSCIAAAGPKVREEVIKYEGAYLEPVGRLSECTKVARNAELGEELWGLTETILRNIGLGQS